MDFKRILTVLALLTLVGSTHVVMGQKRVNRDTTKPTKPVTPQSPARDLTTGLNLDQYWAAQRSIEAAIQRLEAYLKQFPDGTRVETARQQLAVLKSLAVTAASPEWVRMGEEYRRDVPLWRVAAVDPQSDKTRVTVEITCKREDGQDCYFNPFDRKPLVLIDNFGRYYPMLKAGDLPPDIRFKNEGRRGDTEQAVISGGRAIKVIANFAPLNSEITSGQIYYRDENRAQPARFSITSRR